MVDGGRAVAGQFHDLPCVQQVGITFQLCQIIRLQPLRGGRFLRPCAGREGVAFRIFFKLPEENPRVLLPDPVTQPPVGAVDIGEEALVQQIPGAAFADMGGLTELP